MQPDFRPQPTRSLTTTVASWIERTAGESPDLLLQSWTEPREVEPGHLRRADRRAFRRIDLLRLCRQRPGQKCEQQSQCRHVRGQNKPGAIC